MIREMEFCQQWKNAKEEAEILRGLQTTPEISVSARADAFSFCCTCRIKMPAL